MECVSQNDELALQRGKINTIFSSLSLALSGSEISSHLSTAVLKCAYCSKQDFFL